VKERFFTFALNAAVFICGAAVMVYEIIGSRLLAPYIGNSIYIWTSLIGVILGSLSLGYWLGGQLADKKSEIRGLASIIFFAGGLISATTLIQSIVLSMLATAATLLEIKALAASLLLFAPASVFLGMVTPYAVKLKMSSLNHSARTVGNLYALSTIGSIVGTFIAGFFLVPFVGSVRTLYVIAGCLFVTSFILWPIRVSTTGIAAAVVFILAIASNEIMRHQVHVASQLVDIDTEYSRIQVFEMKDGETARPIRVIATDPYFAQSAMYLDSDELVFPYSRYFRLIGHFVPDLKRTLIIGGGGFSFPKHFVSEFPNATIDVVEIDPAVSEIAKKYFRLHDDPRMNVIHEDGRVFLNTAEGGGYDAILIDAFGSLFSVPYQLTTVEAVRNMHRALRDDGVVIANIGSAIDGEGSRFLQAELATYRSVFPQVYIFKARPGRSDTDVQNLVLIALRSDRPASFSAAERSLNDLLANRYPGSINVAEAMLTDDLAPVEFYNSLAQRHFLAGRR